MGEHRERARARVDVKESNVPIFMTRDYNGHGGMTDDLVDLG